jgi:hypothetical protein
MISHLNSNSVSLSALKHARNRVCWALRSLPEMSHFSSLIISPRCMYHNTNVTSMDNSLPDPAYQPVLWCPGRLGQICGRQMGPVRVYLARGTYSKAENRGKLAQRCMVSHPHLSLQFNCFTQVVSDYACLRTIFHTPANKREDALDAWPSYKI